MDVDLLHIVSDAAISALARCDLRPLAVLKLRHIGIDAPHENVALIARNCRQYRPAEFQALEKIEVTVNGRYLVAIVNVVDDPNILNDDELGLGERAFRHFGLAEGTPVELAQANPPASLEAVRRKMDGHALEAGEIDDIIGDIAGNRYSKTEIAAFLISSAGSMSNAEVLALTRAMAKVGNRLAWDADIVVDKHSIGGIPGNRTSMIVVPNNRRHRDGRVAAGRSRRRSGARSARRDEGPAQ